MYLIVSLLLWSSVMGDLIPFKASKFEFFCMQYLTADNRPLVNPFKNKVPEMHKVWYSELSKDDNMRLSLEGGRGSAKTEIAGVSFPIFLACEKDYHEIQTFSRSGGSTGLSTRSMSKIKKHFEHNRVLIHDYGIRKGNKWDQDHIQVVRGDGHIVDIYCRGKRSSARGSRGVVIIDDPQDSSDCRSETVLAADEDWFFSDIYPIMLQDQRLVFIGTSISPISLLSKVQSLGGRWKHLKFPMEIDGKSQWPEQYSQEHLDAQKKDMGIERFLAEYCCQPLVPGNPVIKAQWLKSYDPESVKFQRLKLDGFYTVTGQDCAESKADGADYTFLVTVGATYGAKPDYYVLDARRGHWTTKEGAEQLFLVYKEFNQHKSIVESRCKPPHTDAMIEEIREREKMYGVNVNLYPFRPNRDKVTRLHAVQSIFQEGRVYFDKTDVCQQQLISELTMFTGDQNFHDDGVDGICMSLTDHKMVSKTRTKAVAESAIGANW